MSRVEESARREIAIQTIGLERWFGPLSAVDGIEVRLNRGEFLTIFGPNGAGKTTLLRLLCGSLQPTRGEVWVAGHRVEAGGDGEWRRHIGVLSHQTFLYGGLTAAENLDFYLRLYGLRSRAGRISEALSGVGLADRRNDPVRTFSRGMQQRLALARMLLHDPQVVFLDEPYTGLDAHAAAMLRDVLGRLKDGNRTVVLVTHNLSQGLELADRVAVQVRGRWVSDEPRAAIDPTRFEKVYNQRVGAA